MRLQASLLVALAALCLVQCQPPASTPPPPPLPFQPAPRPPAWKWQNEEQWLMSQIGGSIAILATLARHPQSFSRDDFAVRFVSVNEKQGSGNSLQPLEARLVIGRDKTERALTAKDYLFSPAAWTPIATALIPGPTTGLAGPLLPDAKLLETLLDLKVPVLQRENRRISEALERDALDPTANEQAALLLGAFALREAAGALSDVRPALARMAAHLAVARATRPGEPGLAGRHAEILLLTLVQRQREAMNRIERLQAASPTPVEAAWLRALRLRNTGDWRLRPDRSASLLERLEGFRAVRERLSIDAANRELEKEAREPIVDWARVTLSRPGNVEACGVFGSTLVDQNLREASDVLQLGERIAPQTLAALVTSLTEETLQGGLGLANGRATFAVLDRGLWGRFLERHLVHALHEEYSCLQYTYGLQEEAVVYAGRGREGFAVLPSLRLIGWDFIYGANDASRGFREAIGLLEREPERVPAAVWTELRQNRNYPSLLRTMPDESLWFTTGFLRGTAYDGGNRLHFLKTLRVVRLEDKRSFRDFAPWDYWVVWSYIWKLGGEKPTLELTEREAPDLMQYDERLVGAIADTWPRDLSVYKPVGLRLCELDSGRWPKYGDRLASMGDEEGALNAYRQMLVKTRDEVAISNTLDWLVEYEFEHGRRDEAMKLARRAAATGAGSGYWLLGRQLELRGDLKGAFQAMRAIQERYGARGNMVTIYLRHEAAFRGTPVEAHVKPVLAEIFPKGFEPVALRDLTGAPKDGVRLVGPDEYAIDRLREIGLKGDAVVVGVNGVRVHNLEQYACRRWASNDPALDLIAWQEGRYIAARSTFKDRALNSDVANYVAR